MNYNSLTNKYEINIKITDDLKYFYIIFNEINLTDNAYNTNKINLDGLYSEYKIGLIKVLDENGAFDDNEPNLKEINIYSDNKIKPGEIIKICVDLYDELSGVKSASISYSIGGEERVTYT